MTKRTCYLMYTRTQTAGLILMGVFSKTSYQKAFNQLSDIADRHGTKIQVGTGSIAIEVSNSGNTQCWWLERQEIQ